ILSQLPASVYNSIPSSTLATITSNYWFPNVIAPAFMESLRIAFYISAGMVFLAALASALRGRTIIYERDLMGQAANKTD
ncbi:MAG: MFS transporter, partial [Saccharolobus sp.]